MGLGQAKSSVPALLAGHLSHVCSSDASLLPWGLAPFHTQLTGLLPAKGENACEITHQSVKRKH